MLRNIIFSCSIAGILIFSGCGKRAADQKQPVQKPNIILLFADDMGYGDLQCYGHPLHRTPNLDRMAMDGLKLTSFYVAAPVCSPSRAAILTGRYPMRTGMHHNTGPDNPRGLPAAEITIAEVLKSAGYRTKAVGKWHLGNSKEEYLPTSQGFDEFFGLPYSNDMIRPWVRTDTPLRFYRNASQLPDSVDQNSLTVRYTEEAVDFINSGAGEPFFLYLAYSMPHLPLYPAPQFRGKSGSGLYGDVMMSIDWSVGEIMKSLNALGLNENTLVVFTSDNGPWNNMPPRMLREGIQRWDAGTTNLLRGSKATTFEGGMRVPCIIRWNGSIEKGRISSELTASLDLFPTFAKLAGADLSADHVLDGSDLTGFLLQGEASPRKKHYFFRGDRPGAIRTGEWKLNLISEKSADGEVKVTRELFNLHLDPSERIDRSDEMPERVGAMENDLLEFTELLKQEKHYQIKYH